ncbi:MAG: hypothetical protein EBY29_08130 [Planctomycetes bacterium]|nr:hypothetical protein [Planctomycetota bacterium]
MNQMYLSKLPHRDPFVFVDLILSISENEAKTSWTVNPGDGIFQGHFPGDSIVPGVLLIESMAQTAGLVLIARDPDRAHSGTLVHSDVRFRLPVRPPANILLTATEDGSFGSVHRFSVAAHLENVLVADGTLALSVQSPTVSARDSKRPA